MKGIARRRFKRTLRHPQRLQEILTVLVKYGFSDWIEQLGLDRVFRSLKTAEGWKRDTAPGMERRAKMIRLAFEELGPTFIKLGQIASGRTDLLPIEITRELTNLQDNVAPFPYPDVEKSLNRDLEGSLADHFSSLEKTSAASASIAQVHRGTLLDGREVAVKVQRPGIEELIDTDTDILLLLASLAERTVRRARLFSPVELVEEFRRTIVEELDFERERQNLEFFREQYKHSRKLYVPYTVPELSSHSVLVMEYVEGERLADVIAAENQEERKERIASRGVDIVLEQVMANGVFHADPHPGNILILEDHRICFLDYGIVGSLKPRQRKLLVEAVLGTVQHDADRVTEAMLRLTGQRLGSHRLDLLRDDVDVLIEEYADAAFGEIDINRFFMELLRLVVRYDLKVPANLMLVMKTLVAVEGMGVQLSPDFNFVEVVRPFAYKLLLRRITPQKVQEELIGLTQDYSELTRALPGDIRKILRQAKSGKLRFGFRVMGLEPLRHTLDTISYRLVFGLVVAALLVSSGLIIQANVPPLWNNVSVLGMAGFAVAGFVTLWFLVSLALELWRHR
jgi:ubiquinone biosynthesis protein